MMNFNKHILEAINRGIQLALDDYEDNNEISSKTNIVKNTDAISYLIKNFVDLGLPSGTLWAKYNLGCDWDKLNLDSKNTNPEDWYGNYYAWGETEPKDINKYDWKNYKFGEEPSKYNNMKDGLKNLQLIDDAAYQFDNRLIMPTKEQFEELIEYTIGEWISDLYMGIKRLNGRLLTSKINGNKLFIPAAGQLFISKYKNYPSFSLNSSGVYCRLWSSSLCDDFSGSAISFSFEQYKNGKFRTGRAFGLNIRPILNK